MVMDGGVTVLLLQSPVLLMCLVFKVFHYTCVHSKMSLSSAELNQYLLTTIYRSYLLSSSGHQLLFCIGVSSVTFLGFLATHDSQAQSRFVASRKGHLSWKHKDACGARLAELETSAGRR